MNLLILLTLPETVRNRYRDRLRERFPELDVNLVDHHSKAGPHIATTDILVTFGPMLTDHVLASAPRLKWIQALGTGVDGIVDLPSLRPDVLITKLHGVHGDSMSEAALMLMLALARGLPRVMRNQTAQRWERFPAQLLKDKAVGILGVGAIAAALAPKCKALGMTVVGISSAPRSLAGFDRMRTREELEDAVRELDFLVLLTPYSPETRGIVSARVLAALKPSCFLVNLARGGIVDEAALIGALERDSLAGAALDVFGEEPLPPGHPFWTMERVIVTPHLGGFYDRYPEVALPTVEENVRRFLAGDLANMINVVEHRGSAHKPT